MGINLLMGPSLDVLFTPRPEASGDLGSRAFGGDPYWVGQMGAAYIRGAHGQQRADGGHGPALSRPGRSDRPPTDESPPSSNR